jgi:hypothetical protein
LPCEVRRSEVIRELLNVLQKPRSLRASNPMLVLRRGVWFDY